MVVEYFGLAEGALKRMVEVLLLEGLSRVEDCASVAGRWLEVSLVADFSEWKA